MSLQAGDELRDPAVFTLEHLTLGMRTVVGQ